MKIKVVYTSVAPIEIDTSAFEKQNVEYLEKPCLNEDDVIDLTRDAYVAIIRDEPCSAKVITALEECRLIMTPKVGYDNIDVGAATEAGICVANIKAISANEVSDHVMALLLASSRRLFRLNETVRSGQWHAFHGEEMQAVWRGISTLRSQTLGLIGFGAIARGLVSKAEVFGLNVIAYDPYVPGNVMEAAGVQPVDLNTVLRISDYISVHTPLTTSTRHMLGKEQFKMMKRTAYLINTSRGAVIDEKALYEALAHGYFAGVGLDVLEKEPIDMDNPLLKLDNVIFTGHSAHYSDQIWAEQARRPAEEVNRILSGEWPLCWVNPQVKNNFNKRWNGSRSALTTN